MTIPSRPRKFTIPPLENGDRLSRSEFERRYGAMADIKKADLIEGTVYMASPLRFEPHAEPHADVMTWLGLYKAMTPGVRLGDNPTVRLDRDLEIDNQGIIRSNKFPGLWLDRDAMLTGDMQQVIAVLQTGLASSEHQAFIGKLANA